MGKAYAFANGFFGATPATQTSNVLSYGASNTPGLSLSASGSASGTGILWAAMSSNGDSDHLSVPGVLRAFDASNLSTELWNSDQVASDALGKWAKFCPPTIANGKVYAASNSGQLSVYGLLPHTSPDAPTALTASAGNHLVALNWVNPGRTASFSVKRSPTSGGPYSLLASNITTNYYNDATALNGATYYYIVSAVNTYGESGNSNEASATPNVNAGGVSIGLDFVGGGAAMGAGEVAGVVPFAGWNSLTGSVGAAGQISDNLALPTPLSVTYSCNDIWQLGIADTPGDIRMMNGYLDSSDTSITTVTVSGVPGSFLSSGYDVYVYCNSDGTGRSGDYTIGNVTIRALDNAVFSGAYTQANNSAGNYVVFLNVNANTFTLSAQADQASNGFRAPVNGIQIVAHTTTLPAPTNLTATAGNTQATLNWGAVLRRRFLQSEAQRDSGRALHSHQQRSRRNDIRGYRPDEWRDVLLCRCGGGQRRRGWPELERGVCHTFRPGLRFERKSGDRLSCERRSGDSDGDCGFPWRLYRQCDLERVQPALQPPQRPSPRRRSLRAVKAF